MKARNIAVSLAACLAILPASQAFAQASWRPQTGAVPSYIKPIPAPKAAIQVASKAGLMSALAKAKGGEVISLAPGNYSLELANKSFGKLVTITSASPIRPANISWIKLDKVSNLAFVRLEMSRNAAPGEHLEATSVAKVSGGSNVVFDSVFVHGSLNDNARDDMVGLSINWTDRTQVINSEFTQLGRAGIFGGVSNAVVANNKVHGIRSDGFNFNAAEHVLVDGNIITNFQRIPKDHPDGIQFWTNRTPRASKDIVIRNNQIIQGVGFGSQGIFMRDEGLTMPFERVTIENNLVVGSNMANGIYVDNGIDIRVLNNTVLGSREVSNPVWIKLKNVKNATLEGNVAEVGGNKTPGSAKIDKSLLKGDRFKTIRAEEVVVPGIGFQLAR
ncbi:MAG: right-handed parallel beta-helix repeat-containing protein [Sphingomonadaceae bacterium]